MLELGDMLRRLPEGPEPPRYGAITFLYFYRPNSSHLCRCYSVPFYLRLDLGKSPCMAAGKPYIRICVPRAIRLSEI